ncbi:Smy2p KNAG_0A03430 [Huiozyma naganishii CBS 8797]|uniref:Uncharacterized protein n=1 Tax=Huiozyma naganishii (strain ATCC MYA-139 / BCRC 22969 / CBS 8797 / KCTC 17520 / NBRC 10181 / NCYC 3082 / Yp74L-3) TaxID=1071383 RepID=J7S3K5_HUIN7|nr:hypothetical protein KNAG_0A03430 [Kazachstania naganishii CBS 8797]CCK68026.1 hypothetical protein KNAG_0A03430 [Kazachstania naganishii CBS 8797]
MSSWYKSNYFQPFLQICNVGDSVGAFFTLGELISRVNDLRDPFAAYDRARVATTVTTPVVVATPVEVPVASPQPQVVASGEPQSTTQIVNERVGKAGVTPTAHVESGRDYTYEQLLDYVDPETGGYYHEVAVPVPLQRRLVRKLEQVPEGAVLAEEGLDDVFAVREVLVHDHGGGSVDPTERRKVKAELAAKQLLEEQEAVDRAKKKKEDAKRKKQQQQQQKKNKKKEEVLGKPTCGPCDSCGSCGPCNPCGPLRPPEQVPQTPSFQELQKLEAERKDELLRERRERAERMSRQILEEEKQIEQKRTTLTWASKPLPQQTLSVDIKSQLTQDKNKQTTKKSPPKNPTPPAFDDPAFVKEQERIWEQVQRGATKSPVVPKPTTNAWTTVTKSNNMAPQKTKTKQQQTKQIGSSTTIPALKARYPNGVVTSVSTTANASVSASAAAKYPGNASISLRKEFLKWCKSQLRLNQGISQLSVLEVLLSLPPGSESNEIIADTIYSNSSVMDGRRFAVEFNKRRVECERQVQDPLSWSEALALPEGSADDWEFQIVSKKKGKRH